MIARYHRHAEETSFVVQLPASTTQGAATMLIGYARVSTADQSLDLQRDALQTAGCEQVFSDIVSGARMERPGLTAALTACRPGDTLVVWKLDRLGRSLPHLVESVHDLYARDVGFKSLQEQIDTTTSGGYPLGEADLPPLRGAG